MDNKPTTAAQATEAATQPNSGLAALFDRLMHSLELKLFVIGFLILLLLIPKSMIMSLISERQTYFKEAVNDIATSWADQQTIMGPIMVLPYEVPLKDATGQVKMQVKYVHVLPEKLVAQNQIMPENRQRGIYEVAVYQNSLDMKGHFSITQLKAMGIAPEAVLWPKAHLVMGISDLRGLTNNPEVGFMDQQLSVGSGRELANMDFGTGLQIPIGWQQKPGNLQNMPFSINCKLNGSQALNFIPAAKDMQVKMSANWQAPSFQGTKLPDQKQINDHSFTASWSTSILNQPFDQYWLASPTGIEQAAFGVKLLQPVDHYQKVTRSAKYAELTIILTFLSLYFSELINKKYRLAIYHYILSGLALVVFFLLLLAISEHLGFVMAYLIAAGAIISLLLLYLKSVFGSWKRGLTNALLLVTIYAYIFILLQMQAYALLAGNIGLLFFLALVMYGVQKVSKRKKQAKDLSHQPA